VIQLAEYHARLDASNFRIRIDANRIHRREIDHESIVFDSSPSDVVAATFYRYRDLLLFCEVHCVDDVCGASALDDERRVFVDHSVPDGPCLVVSLIARPNEGATERFRKFIDRFGTYCRCF
jgi:hypothetical protein